MNGCIIPDTPIAVDMWRVRRCPTAKVFFLSHMHSDHTEGLTSTWQHIIYSSPITKKLLINKLQVPSYLIHELQVNESHIVPLDEAGAETMTVTVLDAKHCPGSTMFVFQGYFGTILYTGDFRYSDAMFVDSPLQCMPEIDVLYLDNTYCHPKCVFPSREKCTQKIIEIISAHTHHQILIGIRTLGKEDLLVEIALHFQTWLVVRQSTYNVLEILEAPNVFTTNPDDGYIHAIPFHTINHKLLKEWNQVQPTIAILPTALYTGIDTSPYSNQSNIFVVPYSDHSSFTELHQFVSIIKPKKILSIVSGKSQSIFGNELSERANMSCFNLYLDKKPREKYEIPYSVQILMNKAVMPMCKFIDRQSKPNKKRKRVIVRETQRKRPSRRGVVFCSPFKQELQKYREEKIRTKEKADETLTNLSEEVKLIATDTIINRRGDEKECIQNIDVQQHDTKSRLDLYHKKLLKEELIKQNVVKMNTTDEEILTGSIKFRESLGSRTVCNEEIAGTICMKKKWFESSVSINKVKENEGMNKTLEDLPNEKYQENNEIFIHDMTSDSYVKSEKNIFKSLSDNNDTALELPVENECKGEKKTFMYTKLQFKEADKTAHKESMTGLNEKKALLSLNPNENESPDTDPLLCVVECNDTLKNRVGNQYIPLKKSTCQKYVEAPDVDVYPEQGELLMAKHQQPGSDNSTTEQSVVIDLAKNPSNSPGAAVEVPQSHVTSSQDASTSIGTQIYAANSQPKCRSNRTTNLNEKETSDCSGFNYKANTCKVTVRKSESFSKVNECDARHSIRRHSIMPWNGNYSPMRENKLFYETILRKIKSMK